MPLAPQRSAEPEAARTVVVTRVFELPARLLFAAYTKPEHLRQWFGPPDCPMSTCEMDFRVGGTFRFALTGPDGTPGTGFGGTYLDIVTNQRIRYDNAFEALPPGMPPDVMGTMIVTVTFDALAAEQTRLTVHTVFGTQAMHDAHVGFGYAQGVGASLPQLEAIARAIGAQENHA